MQNQTRNRSKSITTLLGIAGACMLTMIIVLLQPLPNAQAATAAPQLAAIDMTKLGADLNVATSLAAADTAANTTLITPIVWTPPDPAYKIYVEQDGFYKLTYSYLEAAGLPVEDLDPAMLQIFWMGQEIAIEVQDGGDGDFNAGDAVIFYGRGIDSLYYEGLLPDHKYTGTNVYWLVYDMDTGLRMNAKDGAVAGTPSPVFKRTQRWEEQKRYVSAKPEYSSGPQYSPDDDHWFHYYLQTSGGSDKTPTTFFFTPNLPATGSYSMSITAHVVGALNGGHGIRFFVNNTNIFESSTGWVDSEPATFYAETPQTILSPSFNRYETEVFVVDTAQTQAYVDWVEFSYYKEYAPVDEFGTPNNILTFDGEAGAGPWQYTINGYTTDDITIYDVTDIANVQQIENGVVSGAGPYSVQFGDNENERRYVALAGGAYLDPTGIELVTHLESIYTPSRVMVVNNGLGNYNLLDGVNGADWILITHRDFWDEVMPLAEHRTKRYRVAVIDVQEIYDHFNGGLMSAESIRDFLEYTYHNWAAESPEFVLLGGGGTNDMRHYFNNTKETFIPPFLVPVDPTLGETAADNRFVTFIGDDILPDMTIGRFPGFDEFAMTTMVTKSIHYETTPTINDWNTNVLMISDDLEGGGGNFYHFSDTLVHDSADPADPDSTKFLPEPYTATKVYLGRDATDNQGNLLGGTCDFVGTPTAYECRAMISDTLHLEGALLTSYVGHAQTKNWASEKLMDQVLASSMTNYDKLSIFLAMACFEGFFFEPAIGSYSLAETYMTNPNGGAVASWSPTGFGVATGHDWLEQGLFLALFQDHNIHLGSAMDQAKYYMDANTGQYEDLLDTFMLFGDPALQVQVFVQPTAVDIVSFDATRHDDNVTVTWQTANEVDIVGFNILRSESADGEFTAINDELIQAIYPGSPNGTTYELYDTTTLAEQTYWYRLEALIQDGTTTNAGLTELVTPVAADPQIFLPIAKK